MQKNVKNGQIGLILLIIIGVVVAIVMSVASRSLSDTVLSRQEKESSAAFAVAETGVEQALNALRQGSVPSGTTSFTDSSGLLQGDYAVTTTTSYGLFVREGETAHLDLTGYNVANPLTIAWTRKTDPTENINSCIEGSQTTPAAVEITAMQEATNAVVRRYYNSSGCSTLSTSNAFIASADGGSTYLSRVGGAGYVVPAGTTALRIKPIYAGATISVSGSGLQNQLYLIQSKATGSEARKEIEVKRGLDAPPSIFDYAVFAAGTIVKEVL